jgi:hypothetical protein
MVKVVVPGPCITVDELMSQWKGLEAEYKLNGVPHLTKVKAKPQGTGTMLKAAADSTTNIIIRMEIVEEKSSMQLKEYCFRTGQAANDADYQANSPKLPHHVATTLRLVKPWHGSLRRVIGDSWFGSVPCAIELRVRGLYSSLTVKTAHKGFPKKVLTDWFGGKKRRANLPRGSCKYLTTRFSNLGRGINGQVIVASGWADKKCKTIVSTSGHTVAGPPSKRIRHKVVLNPDSGQLEQTVVTHQVPRDSMLASFFDAFPAVDINDHYRQGILAMETNWNTKKYHLRVFSSVFGICLTNSFLAYKYESAEDDKMEFREFLGQLAHELTTNIYLRNDRDTRPRNNAQVTTVSFS